MRSDFEQFYHICAIQANEAVDSIKCENAIVGFWEMEQVYHMKRLQ